MGPGSTVYVAGAGPVGLAAAASAQLLGAAVVIVADMNEARLAHARSFGCETIDLKESGALAEKIEQILGAPKWTARLTAWALKQRDMARTFTPNSQR